MYGTNDLMAGSAYFSGCSVDVFCI